MTAPIISTISPATGLTRGRTYVTITGQNFATQAVGEGNQVKLKVYFGSEEANAVQVVSSTQIFCQSPSNDPGVTNVRVVNIGPPEESVIATGAFTYKRPALATRTHLQEVVEAVINLFKREVIENVVRAVHTEYNGLEEKQRIPPAASLPVLGLSGPTPGDRDAWTVTDEIVVTTYNDDENPIAYTKYRAPVRRNLVFELTIGARIDAELFSLVHHCTQTLCTTPKLRVPFAGGGSVEYDFDLTADFESPAESSNSDVREATASFVIRSVAFEDGEVFETGTVIEPDQIQISYGSMG